MWRARKYLFLLVFLGLLPISCFRPKYPYYHIRRIALLPFSDGALTQQVNTFNLNSTDSVFLKLHFSIDFLAQASFQSFENTCLAFTKPSNGDYGLKEDSVIGVTITSDRTYGDVPPGSLLNQKFRCIFYKELRELESMITDLNNRAPAPYPDRTGFRKLFAAENPSSPGEHNFTFSLDFKSGKRISTNATVSWQ
jgi:hypothetical protein